MSQTKVEAPFVANNANFRNLIINGDMKIAQRATSATGIGSDNGVYPTVDRMIIEVGNTAGRLTMTQEDVTDLPGFTKATKLACTTADTSIASNEFLMLGHRFEGQNLQHIKKGTSSAEKLTVSFYVKGNANATYTCELRDQDNTRFNNIEFSVTTDWTRVVLTFDGDTTGTLDNDNANSFKCNLFLHGGSNFSGGTHTNNVWHTTSNQRLSDSQSSFFDSTSRTFFVTGWQMEVGDTATDFEHLPHDVQLDRCMRYCYVHNNNADSFQQLLFLGATRGGTNKSFYIQHPRPMRDTPSITLSGEIRMINIGQAENVDADDTLTVGGVTPSIVGQNADEKGCNIFFNGAISGMTDSGNTGYILMFQKETDNKLTFDAEL